MRFHVVLESIRGVEVPAIVSLRRTLKSLARAHHLRCLSVREVEPDREVVESDSQSPESHHE